MDAIDTSGQALVEFWKNKGTTGDVNPNTAQAMKAACSTVMSVEKDWQTLDVKTLDTDAVFRRFVNKNSGKFKQGSLQAYARRWPQAVKSFLEYASDPTNWKPPAADKPVLKKKSGGADDHADESTAEITIRAASPATGLIDYPFPLRAGRPVYLRLPADLTAPEVKRLTTFLNSLAIDDAGSGKVA
jgi:hypothetical protein